MTDPSSTAPLLPALPPNRALDEHLRRSLGVLRDRIDDVIRGRSSLRALSRDPAFGALLEPLVTRGMQQLGDLTPDEQRAAEEGAAVFERGAAFERGEVPGTPEPQGPTHGTW